MTTRFYAVDAEGTRWTLAATSIYDAVAEIEGTYYLRKITKHIERVTIETIWSADEAAD